MDYKEKYEMALERAKCLYSQHEVEWTDKDIEYIFPELKKSEDERIRKELITHCRNTRCVTEEGAERIAKWLAWLEKQEPVPQWMINFLEDCRPKIGCSLDYEERREIEGKILAIIKWLEKQGEKLQGKSTLEAIKEEKVDNANKVERKFKEGNWMVFNGLILLVNEVVQGYYRTISIGGIPNSYNWNIDNVARLWTIQDAKNGDVLCAKYGNDEMPFIFTGKQGDVAYCALNSFGEFVLSIAEWLLKTSVLPATKEQRDILFQKMKEAGYTFDFEKKELKKIEQKHTPKHRVGDTIYYNSFGELKSMIVANVVTDSTDNPMYEDKEGNAIFEKDLVEQKFAWSEEDEQNLIDACVAIRKFYHGINGAQELVDWLQSLKQRVDWKPSKEQIRALRWVLNNIPYNTHKEEISGLLDQIKDL